MRSFCVCPRVWSDVCAPKTKQNSCTSHEPMTVSRERPRAQLSRHDPTPSPHHACPCAVACRCVAQAVPVCICGSRSTAGWLGGRNKKPAGQSEPGGGKLRALLRRARAHTDSAALGHRERPTAGRPNRAARTAGEDAPRQARPGGRACELSCARRAIAPERASGASPHTTNPPSSQPPPNHSCRAPASAAGCRRWEAGAWARWRAFRGRTGKAPRSQRAW